MHNEQTHGVIDMKINNIPINMFIKDGKFSSEFIIPTEKIITGILNIITIKLPIV